MKRQTTPSMDNISLHSKKKPEQHSSTKTSEDEEWDDCPKKQ